MTNSLVSFEMVIPSLSYIIASYMYALISYMYHIVRESTALEYNVFYLTNIYIINKYNKLGDYYSVLLKLRVPGSGSGRILGPWVCSGRLISGAGSLGGSAGTACLWRCNAKNRHEHIQPGSGGLCILQCGGGAGSGSPCVCCS